MARITSMSPQRRQGRFNIHLDDVFWLGVPLDVLAAHVLAVGVTISDAKRSEIERDCEVYAARQRALNVLSHRAWGITELRERLLRAGHPEHAVDTTMASLSMYLDDNAFAQQVVESQIVKGRNRAAIAGRLRRHRLDPEVVSAALEEHYHDNENDLLASRIVRGERSKGHGRRATVAVLRLRGVDGAVAERVLDAEYPAADEVLVASAALGRRRFRDQAHAQRYLAGRGFGWDVIRDAVRVSAR